MSVFIFCDGEASSKNPLHKVLTENGGHLLHKAIEEKETDKLHVKLCTAVDSCDAHAIHIRYHKRCWTNNVVNVLRTAKAGTESSSTVADEIAAKIEFLTMTERALIDGEVLTIPILRDAYESIMSANNVNN